MSIKRVLTRAELSELYDIALKHNNEYVWGQLQRILTSSELDQDQKDILIIVNLKLGAFRMKRLKK